MSRLSECFFKESVFFDDSNNYVCIDCLYDKGLKKLFLKLPRNNEYECISCEKEIETIEVSDLQIHLRKFIKHGLAEDDAIWDNEDKVYLDKTYKPEGILSDLIAGHIHPKLHEELDSLLVDKLYTNYNKGELVTENTWNQRWNKFKAIIKQRSRFFFSQIPEEYDEFENTNISSKEFLPAMMVALCRANAFKLTSEELVIYRGRNEDLENPDFEQLTSSPSIYASNSRFSPRGISMFYGAEDIDTALCEIRATCGQTACIGKFVTTRNLCLIDLTQLEFPGGYFDPDWIDDYKMADFLNGFRDEIVQPVKSDGSEHIEYIPTQFICEYLRYFGMADAKNNLRASPEPNNNLFKELECSDQIIKTNNHLDGLCYNSSITGKKCYVLFYDQEESESILRLETHKVIKPLVKNPQLDFSDIRKKLKTIGEKSITNIENK